MSFIVLSKMKGEVVADDSKNAIQKYSSDMNHFLLPCRFFQKYAQSGLFEKSLIDYSKEFCIKDKLFLDHWVIRRFPMIDGKKAKKNY